MWDCINNSDEEEAIQLQTLHGIARERSDMCNWEQNFRPVLLKLIAMLEKENAQLQVLSLRVLREMLKSKPDLLKDYTEMTVMKVLNTYCCEAAEVCSVCVCVFVVCMCVCVCLLCACVCVCVCVCMHVCLQMYVRIYVHLNTMHFVMVLVKLY